MNNNDSFWQKCGVIELDHVAVTTPNLLSTLVDYMGISGARLVRGPAHNAQQNVDYAFVQLSSGTMVEILGVTEGSPIASHVASSGGAYHLCFEVDEIDESIAIAESEGAKLVVEAREDGAFDGRKVAFMMHENHGLFEFLQRLPSSIVINTETSAMKPQSASSAISNKNSSASDIDKALTNVFKKLFPDINSNIESASYENIDEWDSLKHLVLVMEIERCFELRFEADTIKNLTSYLACRNEVEQRLSR